MEVTGWETGEIVEILRRANEQQIAELQEQLLRISTEFNRSMDHIMTIEWIAFGLACVAMIMLAIKVIRERKNGRHSR